MRRRQPWLGDREVTPRFPQRGRPANVSLTVMERYVEERADGEGVFHCVPNPNWHSASWLYRDEILVALDRDWLVLADLDLMFRVVLDVMANFDDRLGPRRSRLVFWFDN